MGRFCRSFVLLTGGEGRSRRGSLTRRSGVACHFLAGAVSGDRHNLLFGASQLRQARGGGSAQPVNRTLLQTCFVEGDRQGVHLLRRRQSSGRGCEDPHASADQHLRRSGRQEFDNPQLLEPPHLTI